MRLCLIGKIIVGYFNVLVGRSLNEFSVYLGLTDSFADLGLRLIR